MDTTQHSTGAADPILEMAVAGLIGAPGPNQSRWRRWLAGAAVAAFLGVLITPPTGWMVRTQVRWEFRKPLSYGWLNHKTRLKLLAIGLHYPDRPDDLRAAAVARQFASAHPDDLDVQIAAADSTDELRSLTTRFPRSPALDAAILRSYLTLNFSLQRDETYWLDGTPKPPPDPRFPDLPLPSMQQLDSFDACAAVGGMSDPDNAYFPAVRAVGLFAAHSDREAIDALLRAATKTRWEDYERAEVDGNWRIIRDALGDSTAEMMHLTATMTDDGTRHGLWQANWLALYWAVVAEQSSHLRAGLRIRESLMRLGRLIRLQSRSVFGSMRGASIEEMAVAHLGDPIGVQGQSGRVQRRAAYERYLRNMGRADEAALANSEWAEVDRFRDAERKQSEIIFQPTFRLLEWWTVDSLLLETVLSLLALAGAAVLLATYRIERGVLPVLALLVVVPFLALEKTIVGGEWFMGIAISAFTADGTIAGDESLIGNLIPALPFPGLILVVSGIGAAIRRRPLAAALVNGVRAAALPIACVLTLLYAGSVILTTPVERHIRHIAIQIADNEAGYLMAQAEKKGAAGR